jgi:hypothetical protein
VLDKVETVGKKEKRIKLIILLHAILLLTLGKCALEAADVLELSAKVYLSNIY